MDSTGVSMASSGHDEDEDELRTTQKDRRQETERVSTTEVSRVSLKGRFGKTSEEPTKRSFTPIAN